jgi:short-subunit dehydrogenase
MVLSRLLTPRMVARCRGHVVFVSSLAAVFPTPGLTIYNATKAALASYGLSRRGELVPHGVGDSVVYPGPISGAGMWAEPPGRRHGTADPFTGGGRRSRRASRRTQPGRDHSGSGRPAVWRPPWPMADALRHKR